MPFHPMSHLQETFVPDVEVPQARKVCVSERVLKALKVCVSVRVLKALSLTLSQGSLSNTPLFRGVLHVPVARLKLFQQ